MTSSFSGLSLILVHFLMHLFVLLKGASFVHSKVASVPAMYVFGDSLVDVGNNNYIKSVIKANFRYNGIDYLRGKSTGRFSNGKIAADFLAEKMGLPTPPPYLRNVKGLFIKGVNFASGGAGIFNTTNGRHIVRSLSLTRQVNLFASKVRPRMRGNRLSKSIFFVVIGSNDLIDYFRTKFSKRRPPLMYVNDMVSQLQVNLQELYRLGARKFLILGLPPIGCSPRKRSYTKTNKCDEISNLWANKYNQQLKIMLKHSKSVSGDAKYSYFDIYGAIVELIHNATNYGFTETNAACCGLGRLKTKFYCTPVSRVCPNRTNHLFWDLYHPSEAASSIIVDFIFSGKYTTPISLNQLIAS